MFLKQERIVALMAKNVLSGVIIGDNVHIEKSDEALELFNKSRFGSLDQSKNLQLSFFEALYLIKKNSLIVYDGRKKPYDVDRFIKKASQKDKSFWVRYCVFSDLRTRGYIVKTALKFGADFRVYDRGIKPGDDHAKWVVYPVHESTTLTWHDFSAKNRVAHSTKKRLMVGVVDDESDVTYYEIAWKRP